MSLLKTKLLENIKLGTHIVRLIGVDEGVTKPTADGKGGEAYITLQIILDDEPAMRDSFSDPGLCFIKQGFALQRFVREVKTQLPPAADLAELLEHMKRQPVVLQVGEKPNIGTGIIWPTYTWTVPAAQTTPAAPPAELPEDIQL